MAAEEVDVIGGAKNFWLYKNRLSGFWGGTGVERALMGGGIRTLIFAGANTNLGISLSAVASRTPSPRAGTALC